MSEHRIILDPDILPDDFRTTAADAGWTLVNEAPPSGLLALELVYRLDGHDASTVHYIEDSYIKVRYALTRGPQADALVGEVTDLFAYAPDDAVREAAEDDDEGLQHIVSWMLSATALGDQAGHAWLSGLIEKRLAHDASAVRRAALVAASWLEWPDFRATVERMAQTDPAPDVRQDAAKLARAYGLRDEGKL